MKTTVVHVNDVLGYDSYIGRANPRRGLKASPFANPFKIGVDGDRAEVIAKYRLWLIDRPALIHRAVRELRGKRLGCWCAPEACHGDVLAEIADSGGGIQIPDGLVLGRVRVKGGGKCSVCASRIHKGVRGTVQRGNYWLFCFDCIEAFHLVATTGEVAKRPTGVIWGVG